VNGVAGKPLTDAITLFQTEQAFKFSPDGNMGPYGTTFKTLVTLLPAVKGTRLDIIFGKTRTHTKLLSKVNGTRLKTFVKKELGLVNKNEDFAGFFSYLKQDTAVTDIRWAAYFLATAYHETGFTFKPLAEKGKGKGKSYGTAINVKDTQGLRGPKNKVYANTYYGRGYVQLTWEGAYKEVGTAIGVKELHVNPDKAMESATAYKIMSHFMRNDIKQVKGKGRKISEYISGNKCDYKGARRIVNVQESAAKIAGYAEEFEILVRLCAVA
jgi:hypothetical protein